ncbi:MAG: HU family DNA-binding protein [Clostridiales bacterium]|nr:HU family DNA-binding protein [Clostridiales bacterium]
MNKNELIAGIAENSGLSKKDAEKALTATLTVIENTLKTGEKVSIVGFGNFEVKTRAARRGRNPATKEEIMIAESKAPSFKAAKALKDAIK